MPNLKSKTIRTIDKVNFVKKIFTQVFGQNHSTTHRIIAGLFLIVGGVIISKTIGHHDIFAVQIFGDGLGYGLHGIGLVPIIDALVATLE